MTFPILEYDPSRKALIEPSQFSPIPGMPEHCVICFFSEVIEKVVGTHQAKMIVENRWEDGPHPIYVIEYQEQRLAFYHPGIGAALSASLLEEAIAFGGRKFIACGGCGVLDNQIDVGNIVVVSSAIRDEGVSYHYLPPAREVIAQKHSVTTLRETLDSKKIPYRIGKTWTTDAPYRETRDKIAQRKAEGALTVEMEAAGMFAVAQFRQVSFGQILYGGDDVSGPDWDARDWQSRTTVRENLFWLAAEACLAL